MSTTKEDSPVDFAIQQKLSSTNSKISTDKINIFIEYSLCYKDFLADCDQKR